MKETAFSEADSHSADQIILPRLWNRKVYQHFHKNHLLNHFLGKSSPVRMITSYLSLSYIYYVPTCVYVFEISEEKLWIPCPVPLICFDFIALEHKLFNL